MLLCVALQLSVAQFNTIGPRHAVRQPGSHHYALLCQSALLFVALQLNVVQFSLAGLHMLSGSSFITVTSVYSHCRSAVH
jgi:hypothetical protein